MTVRRAIFLLVLLVVLVAGAGFYADVSELAAHAARFDWIAVVPALLLASANYVLRFGKWQYFLRRVFGRLPVKDSALVFFSGLSMSVTPGKLGEVLKSYLLKERCGVPISASLPVVLAERLTDLLSLIVLAAFGVATLGYGWDIVLAAVALCGLVIMLALWRRAAGRLLSLASRLPLVRSWSASFAALQDSLYNLVGVRSLTAGTAISAAAWFAECVAFHLVLRAAGIDFSLANATFVYSLGTIAGAVTMLPGGLVATEAGMVFLLAEHFHAAGPAEAVLAVLVVRLCTLWFAVLVGLVAFMASRRRPRRIRVRV